MARYRVNIGISYPPNKRAEIGDIVDDLPSTSIKWLSELGYIELVDAKKAATTPEPISEGEEE